MIKEYTIIALNVQNTSWEIFGKLWEIVGNFWEIVGNPKGPWINLIFLGVFILSF